MVADHKHTLISLADFMKISKGLMIRVRRMGTDENFYDHSKILVEIDGKEMNIDQAAQHMEEKYNEFYEEDKNESNRTIQSPG